MAFLLRHPSGCACRVAALLLLLAPVLTLLSQRAGTAAPLDTIALRSVVEQPRTLERIGPVVGGDSFSAYLVAYRLAGLRLHALVAVPWTPPPPQGYPVLVANHGFHPDPPRYGITPEGRDWRPGNYCRSRTDETGRVVEGMVDGLNGHVVDGIGSFFDEKFRWMGNAGCGTKIGLKAFQNNWQRPFQAAFSDKVCTDEARIAEGEWMAAFGSQRATHSGEFMGIAPTGKQVQIRCMDFWRVKDGKIVDSWVMVDSPDVLRQLGLDVFGGQGWEAFDEGRRQPPRPVGLA